MKSKKHGSEISPQRLEIVNQEVARNQQPRVRNEAHNFRALLVTSEEQLSFSMLTRHRAKISSDYRGRARAFSRRAGSCNMPVEIKEPERLKQLIELANQLVWKNPDLNVLREHPVEEYRLLSQTLQTQLKLSDTRARLFLPDLLALGNTSVAIFSDYSGESDGNYDVYTALVSAYGLTGAFNQQMKSVALLRAYKDICPYCNQPITSLADLEIDHIIPESQRWVEDRTFVWLITGEVLDEYREVLARLGVRRPLIGEIVNTLRGPTHSLSPDPDDNPHL